MSNLLFTINEQESFSNKLKNLSNEALNSLAEMRVLERGYEYFNQGLVYPNIQIEKGKITAEVNGTENYIVQLEQHSEQVFGHCSCPYDYGGICKHLVAVIFHLQHFTKVESLQEVDK